MGWTRGTELMEDLVEDLVACYRSLHTDVDDETRREFYRSVLDILGSHDWDCEYEVAGLDPCLDDVLDDLGFIEGEEDDDVV